MPPQVDSPPPAGGVAFGAPGIPPTFAAGDKDAVTTSLSSSRVWATIGGGVLNWAIRSFGGSGDVGQTRAGLFVSSVPLLWVMALLCILASSLSGETPTGIGVVEGVLTLAAVVWVLVLLTTTLSKAHHTTGVRVFVALILTALIAYLPWVTCIGLMGVIR